MFAGHKGICFEQNLGDRFSNGYIWGTVDVKGISSCACKWSYYTYNRKIMQKKTRVWIWRDISISLAGSSGLLPRFLSRVIWLFFWFRSLSSNQFLAVDWQFSQSFLIFISKKSWMLLIGWALPWQVLAQ